jgi:hypothetical protein
LFRYISRIAGVRPLDGGEACRSGAEEQPGGTADRETEERMYPVVLGVHNLARWVVIAAGVWAVVRIWSGWVRRSPWTDGHARAARLFTGALDLQFLVGLVLYLFFSPLTREAFRDLGAAMRDAPVRYFVVEHVVIMFAAIVVAHIGAGRVRRARTDAAKFQQAALWLGVALAAVLGFVPWARPLVPSF